MGKFESLRSGISEMATRYKTIAEVQGKIPLRKPNDFQTANRELADVDPDARPEIALSKSVDSAHDGAVGETLGYLSHTNLPVEGKAVVLSHAYRVSAEVQLSILGDEDAALQAQKKAEILEQLGADFDLTEEAGIELTPGVPEWVKELAD